jgi:formylglycine-generating enzyme required for sulfatase activity
MNVRFLWGLLACILGGLAWLSCPGQPEAASDTPLARTIVNSIGMKLALIPAGKFLMGSPATEIEREDKEVQHEVTFSRPFYMGACEVTQRDYEKVVREEKPWHKSIFTKERGGSPDHPRENVRLWQVERFCKQLSDRPDEKRAGRTYRLPTEAEWEYACRAGTTTAFHTGNSLSSRQANFNGNDPYGSAARGPYLRKTARVGSYAPNAWGLYDMHGNVMELCSDFYDKNYYRDSPRVDPRGPAKGALSTDFDAWPNRKVQFYRVVRGGCWLDEARACRSARRWRAMPQEPSRLIGFRVVCEVGRMPRP